MGLVVGAAAGVLVLGAGVGAAVAFGNVGATIANASGVFDGGFGGFDIGAFAGDVADCSCCDSIPCVVRPPPPPPGAPPPPPPPPGAPYPRRRVADAPVLD